MIRLDSPIPSISISPAPPKEPSPIEPQRSPYVITLIPTNIDSPRPQHLLPPPSPHHRSSRKQVTWTGHGIDMAVFETLLQGAKSKQIDMKAISRSRDVQQIGLQRQAKQLERRARFLAKIAESPKASAINTPVTPPESPAVFHFSLPSPGLESPCEVFVQQGNMKDVTRVEQVHFPTKKTGKGFLPSLELITERMNKRMSPPPIEENRQSDTRTAATIALYDALNRRRATTATEPPGIIASSNAVRNNNIIISRATEWRSRRQMAGAQLMYQRPHVVLC